MSDKSEPSPLSSDVASPASVELLDPSSEGSVEMKDLSELDQSSTSKMDVDTSSSSLAANVSTTEKNKGKKDHADAPKPKKIKLSATQSKLLKEERERLKKEREELRAEALKAKLEKEKEKVEKERERIEAALLKQKQKEDEKKAKDAEKKRKEQEAAEKKEKLEKEKQEKLKEKEEERVRKENERIQAKEAKEKEKQRRLDEKKAEEDRKKQEEELKEKKLQKSRDVMFNFLKKSKSNSDMNSSSSNVAEDIFMKKAVNQQKEKFDLEAFNLKIAGQNVPKESLYVKELLSGKIKPWVTSRRKVEDDCMVIDDELGDQPKKNEVLVFLQFAENTRPAYFGKRFQELPLVTLTGRTPFKKQNFLDYEVDSDDEWEEEGPGESLSGSDSEVEKDKDDYELNDFFVPHGYLSDEENNLEEDDSEVDRKPSGSHMKEQALLAERSSKFNNKLTPQMIGCIWEADKEQHRDQYQFLQQFKAVRIV